MLDALRRGQRWWTAAVVVFVGGVFAVFIGLGGPLQSASGSALVVVGDVEVGPAEYERARRQQIAYYERVFGEQFDPQRLGDEVIEQATVRMLIERTILAQEAERLGLTVAKKEVERGLLANPGLRGPDGRFNREAFDNWVYQEFGSERAFREQQRRATLAQKLLRVLSTQAFVSEGEARDAVERRLESVKIIFTVLDTTVPPVDFERDEAAIEALFASREDAVRKAYEERSEEFNTPEQTRARHILLRIPADSSDEQVAEIEKRILELRKRLEEGEDFALLADISSDDPGSKANGGDLGYFARGTMVPAFDEVAFRLEPGVLSEPVRTDYGFHLILVEDRKPAEMRSFEDVKADLAFEMLSAAASRDAAWNHARALAAAVRGGQSLEDAAREAELTLERTDWILRRPDSYVEGLGAAPKLRAVAFVLDAGESSDRIFEVGDKLAMVQVAARKPADPEVVAQEVEAERARLGQQKLNLLTDSWVGQRRDQLRDSGQLVVNVDLTRRP